MRRLKVNDILKMLRDKGLEAELMTVHKHNKDMDAIVIKNSNVSPCYYVDSLENAMIKNNLTENDIYDFIVKSYELIDMEEMSNVAGTVMSFDDAKPLLRTGLRNNDESKDDVAYVQFLDMKCYAFLQFGEYKVDVTNKLLESWDVQLNDVLNIASENCKNNIEVACILKEDERPDMFSVEVAGSHCGASSVCFNAIKDIANKYNNNVWAMPIDVHRLTVIMYTGETFEHINMMAKMMSSIVPDEEKLLTHGYLYVKDEDVFKSTAPE